MNDPYQPPQELSPSEVRGAEIAEAIRQDLPAGRVAYTIFWQNLGLLLAIFGVVWVPLNIVIAYLEAFVIDAEDFRSSWRLEQQATWWFGSICTGAAVSAIAAAYQGGHRSFLSTIGHGLRLWPKLWTTYFVYALVTALGLVVFVIPGIYFAVRGLYAMTIAAAEEVHGPTAINRSFALTRNRFYETLGRGLCVIGVYVLANAALAAILIGLYLGIEFTDGLQVSDPLAAFTSWLWIAEGILPSLTLVANAFASVYVYCWYRYVDENRFGRSSDLPEKMDLSGLVPSSNEEKEELEQERELPRTRTDKKSDGMAR